MPDEVMDGAAGGTDSSMQTALRGIQMFGNAVEREVRVAQVVGYMGTDPLAQGASRGLQGAAAALLVDRQIDDLGNRFGQHVRTLGSYRGELFDEPPGDAEYEPAHAGRSRKRPDRDVPD